MKERSPFHAFPQIGNNKPRSIFQCLKVVSQFLSIRFLNTSWVVVKTMLHFRAENHLLLLWVKYFLHPKLEKETFCCLPQDFFQQLILRHWNRHNIQYCQNWTQYNIKHAHHLLFNTFGLKKPREIKSTAFQTIVEVL